MRQATMTALEIRDEADIMRDLDRGELEARILQGERAQASAPPEVSSQLRLTAQAEADALRQAQHDQAGASSAQALARQLAAERQRLEAGNTRYENWSAGTRATRQAAGKARSELARRGQARTEGEPQPQDQPRTTAGWWREFEADAEAAERAIGRQHQGAIDAGEPWPPRHPPQLGPPPEPHPAMNPEDEPARTQPMRDDTAARLKELLARVDQAAQSAAAREVERQASSEYAARIEREAQAEPQAQHQAEVPDQAQIEL
jgi:hypothetical protein